MARIICENVHKVHTRDGCPRYGPLSIAWQCSPDINQNTRFELSLMNTTTRFSLKSAGIPSLLVCSSARFQAEACGIDSATPLHRSPSSSSLRSRQEEGVDGD